MKIETFKDLKEFLGTLSEKQLSQSAILHRVDIDTVKISDAIVTVEDEYSTDEGFAPVSTFEPDSDTETLDSHVIRPAGHVYLFNE